MSGTSALIMWSFIVVGAVVGGAGGVGAAWWAHRRNAAQPIDLAVEAEHSLLDALERDPGQWVRVIGELDAEHFSHTERSERYRQLLARHSAGSDLAAEIDAAGAVAAEAQVRTWVQTARDRAEADGWTVTPCEGSDIVRWGSEILGAAEGRAQQTPRSPLEPTGDTDVPYRRVAVEASRRRYVTAGVAGEVGGVASAGIALSAGSTTAAAAALLVLLLVTVIGGIVISCVDIDTYFLDTPSFWPWCALCWALTALATAVDGRIGHAVLGAGMVVAVGGGFEAVSWLWGRIRHMTQGAGDTLIALVTAGVPVAVSGRWEAGLWSVLAAGAGVIVHWLVLYSRQRASAQTPIAFGPYLVAGAIAALAAWSLMGV
jgi:prepilin signal peptidase PulO-like enzyme (type II secretory pathway)